MRRYCIYGKAAAAWALAGAAISGPSAAFADSIVAPNLVVAEVVGPLAALPRADDRLTSRVPAVLGASDIAAYRRIFALQEDGDWAAADSLIGGLDNDVLLGHVRFQRYMHPTAYRSSYDELHAWLERYADHPGAMRLYRLAVKRHGDDAPPPRRPQGGYLSGVGEVGEPTGPTVPGRKLGPVERRAADAHFADIERLATAGKTAAALAALAGPETRRWLSNAQVDSLRTAIARAYFSAGRDREAYDIAARAAARSGRLMGSAHWTAGLAAWRLGRVAVAAEHFSALAALDEAEILVAGGAYWAARAYALLRQPMRANRMLLRAAGYPRTLYGLLAHRSLFRSPAFTWQSPRLSEAMVRALLATPGARRAIALDQIGRADLAEAEVRKLYPRLGEDMAAALLALSDALSLPGVEIRLGSQLGLRAGRHVFRSLYPVPEWRPASGFAIDRALLFALVRQESVFDSRATSEAGARGLMQLMPRTASYVDGERDYHRGGADALYAPELNLALGQKYVRYLLDSESVAGNLVLMLAAYNAGPARLAEWRARIDYRGDPLLFIEALPSLETRRYVRRVLANLWIYRDRMGQAATSLDDLALGRWPAYRPHEHKQLAGLGAVR